MRNYPWTVNIYNGLMTAVERQPRHPEGGLFDYYSVSLMQERQ